MKMTKISLILSMLLSGYAVAAFDDAGTDYSDAATKTFVWNEALSPIELVNSILCFTAQFNATEFANEGAYAVLADESTCFDNEKDGSEGQSSGATNAPAYMKAIANVTRDDDASPLEVNVWLPEMGEGDEDQAIKFKASISEGASASNPFGDFTINFDFFDSLEGGESQGSGYVETINSDSSIGFVLYENAQHGGGGYTQSASVVMDSDRSDGVALTSVDHDSHGETSYALAFNSTHVLIQSANGDFDDLAYKSGDNSGQCLSRTEFNNYVHRYDLYNATTGAQVDVNSGFSMKYDSNDDGNYDSYGHIGYWGAWTEGENALSNGDTIIRDVDGQEETYTYINTPGRLILNTVKSLNLSNARGVQFSFWDTGVKIVNDASSGNTTIDITADGISYSVSLTTGQDISNWLVEYKTAADDGVDEDGFYIVGTLAWGENGPDITDLTTPALLTLASDTELNMHSEQLGGEVRYFDGETALNYFEQTFINGSETGSGELLESGSITLSCFDNCIVGTLETDDLANFYGSGSPYIHSNSAINYTFATTGDNALTLVRVTGSEPVRYAADLTQSDINSTVHSWGVRSGPMTLASDIETRTEMYDGTVTSFYVWETGINSWNQLATIQDSDDEIVTFSRPIQVSYTHSDANDRDGDAGDNDGKPFLLNYGGNGDLWGIPYANRDQRYRPAFSIADGTLVGSSNQYVVKALDIEMAMQDATGECGSLTLADTEVAVPTSVSGSANIGDMPTVTDDHPAVIAGVTQ